MNEILEVLQEVKDPEIPVISIVELGIVRDISGTLEEPVITLTPTYSGCPAMDIIPQMVREALTRNGFQNAIIKNVLSPAWTTDWISEEGKRILKEYGIVPPVENTSDASFLSGENKIVPCPRCGESDTKLVSQFGSTPCKAAYQCNVCLEPFDYFKCH